MSRNCLNSEKNDTKAAVSFNNMSSMHNMTFLPKPSGIVGLAATRCNHENFGKRGIQLAETQLAFGSYVEKTSVYN